MNALFLTCALALPLCTKSDYVLLKEFIERRYPHLLVVFVHKDETLLNPGAEFTPMTAGPEGLRIWTIKRSA